MSGEEAPEQRRYCIEGLERLWIEYDRQNDVLYIYLAPEDIEAEESFLVGEDTVVSVRGDTIVSIAIMNFTKRVGLET